MRRLVIAIVLLMAAPVYAEEPQVIDYDAERSGAAVGTPAQVIDEKSEQTGSAVHPTQLMRERQLREEQGQGGRSGFWTSRQPAKGGAYRWRLLLLGIGLIGITGGVITYFIKRANRSNKSRPDPWADWVAKKKSAEKQAEPKTPPPDPKSDESSSDDTAT